ncbi:hypothetical protein A2372_01360 [Candidatus Wolfebacteria bacterium RIFOXYB1_FULL_54_12]|uniref:Response regulatory domain-containing protein n=1 Tax=Candidatus Wolfebacteria bacterium RIFOXYB1_FULL_54_12 TaxID=1802559 RepID=A0A1F8DYE7_9BACT|nr:MAG: hypothetical protein A2372_01360 [Candidatus Wolfebacteria bacterium RIFOXYB1_FULL_54_12]
MEHKIVLMVDEDHDFSSIIETKLKSKGFDVRLAYMPETGMQMIKELRPALVLLDINLPGMNGLDFLVELKKDESMKDIKVAFFSSLVNPWTNFMDVKEASKELGATTFIDKAIDLDRLVEQVGELIAAPEEGM